MLVHLSRLATHLTACVPVRLAIQSELVQVAMHFLNFEARHLFGSISQLQLGIVDRYFDLAPEDAKKLVAPMEVSLKQSDELAKFMRFCQQVTHSQSNAAELKVRPLSLACLTRLLSVPTLRGATSPPLLAAPAQCGEHCPRTAPAMIGSNSCRLPKLTAAAEWGAAGVRRRVHGRDEGPRRRRGRRAARVRVARRRRAGARAGARARGGRGY